MMRINNNKMIKTLLVAAFSFYSLASNAANEQYTFDTNAYLAGTFDFDSATSQFSNFNLDTTGLILDGFIEEDIGTSTNPFIRFADFSGLPSDLSQFNLQNPIFAPDYSIGLFDSLYIVTTDMLTQSPNEVQTPVNLTFALTPVVAAVPEPETYAMFLSGLGLLGFAKRRQQA